MSDTSAVFRVRLDPDSTAHAEMLSVLFTDDPLVSTDDAGFFVTSRSLDLLDPDDTRQVDDRASILPQP